MNHEFLERKDGFDHFSEKYQLNLKKENIISNKSGFNVLGLEK